MSEIFSFKKDFLLQNSCSRLAMCLPAECICMVLLDRFFYFYLWVGEPKDKKEKRGLATSD